MFRINNIFEIYSKFKMSVESLDIILGDPPSCFST